MFIKLTVEMAVSDPHVAGRRVIYPRGQTFMARPEGDAYVALTPERGLFDLEVYADECEVVG
jgi:hypothetical protein